MALTENLRDFWVVAGTAAPIIALANQVALGESLGKRKYYRIARDGNTQAIRTSAREVIASSRWLWIISNVNLFLQAGVLFWSLLNLIGNISVGATAVAVIELVGILILFGSAMATHGIRNNQQEFEQLTQRDLATQAAAETIAATLRDISTTLNKLASPLPTTDNTRKRRRLLRSSGRRAAPE
jgi:hypothetical protein